ncbi:MAG: hypothetical protein IJW59_05475 [Clostridia bacterium]|nr:hypothetical protein [Clostridia bacterium]
MKYSRSIFIFSIINLICTFICIKYLPDNVIFGITGNFYASEFISKWANLIIPIAQVICMGIIYFVDVFNRNVPHKYRYLISWVAIAFTTYLMWVLMFLQLENNEIGVPLNWPWTIIILFPIALFLFAEGFDEYNKNPNEFSIFGVKWVKGSSLVWSKTHKMAGIITEIVAITLIVLSIVNELVWHTNWIYLVAVLIWVFVYYLFTLLYSYALAKEYGTN